MSELKDGLMLGLRKLDNQSSNQEMLAWSNSNRWVANGFVWGKGQEVTYSKDTQNRNLSIFKDDDGWAWQKTEKAKEVLDDGLEVESLAQVDRDEKMTKEADEGVVAYQSESEQNDLLAESQISQSEALDSLQQQRERGLGFSPAAAC